MPSDDVLWTLLHSNRLSLELPIKTLELEVLFTNRILFGKKLFNTFYEIYYF